MITGGCSSMDGNKKASETGILPPCPLTPNCVSSQSKDSVQYIKPIRYSGMTSDEAFNKMVRLLENEKRARIVKADKGINGYIHAEFRTLVFRFTDDVEFIFPPDENIIDVRSASRLGISDLGVNRRRVEHIRKSFLSE
ncbi:MAG: DUF1499 domain-containing protein [Spirochaetales bacterium]|nr:DUF1499 domain-containing protein [Spirochaetales bacterium]